MQDVEHWQWGFSGKVHLGRAAENEWVDTACGITGREKTELRKTDKPLSCKSCLKWMENHKE